MILFKQEHVAPILAGTKTETRRLGDKRWNVGAVHLAKTQMFGPPFARLLVRDLWQEMLVSISEDGAKAEGYESVAAYLPAFAAINHVSMNDAVLPFVRVWVVQFELVEAFDVELVIPAGAA